MKKREAIIAATKMLFWEKGYEATSPRDIQHLSDAGQGSFYHHFRSKKELAAEAIEEVVSERIGEFEAAMSGHGTVKERIRRLLGQKKDSFKGCRVGRMVWDSAVNDEKLRRPLEKYFHHIETRLKAELNKAARNEEVKLLVPPQELALVIIAVIQGGFTVSKAMQLSRVPEATKALYQLLDVAVVEL